MLSLGCESVINVPTSHLDRTVDCGPVPIVARDEVRGAANQKWGIGNTKDIILLPPARAAWSVRYGPTQYGYISVFEFVKKGVTKYDIDSTPFGAFYKNGTLVMVDRVWIPTLRVTFLDREEANMPNQSTDPMPVPGTTPAGQESRHS
jgi:hypothetical protein